MAFLEGELAALEVLHRLWVSGCPAGRGSAIPSPFPTRDQREGLMGQDGCGGILWW